mmetsp:Transcript_30500/g.99117  ORF Transcript_30500/g.99117 Transcript_30500/m.99117 type:complete len:325 (-) Transcript_30500:1210-2184(-)
MCRSGGPVSLPKPASSRGAVTAATLNRRPSRAPTSDGIASSFGSSESSAASTPDFLCFSFSLVSSVARSSSSACWCWCCAIHSVSFGGSGPATVTAAADSSVIRSLTAAAATAAAAAAAAAAVATAAASEGGLKRSRRCAAIRLHSHSPVSVRRTGKTSASARRIWRCTGGDAVCGSSAATSTARPHSSAMAAARIRTWPALLPPMPPLGRSTTTHRAAAILSMRPSVSTSHGRPDEAAMRAASAAGSGSAGLSTARSTAPGTSGAGRRGVGVEGACSATSWRSCRRADAAYTPSSRRSRSLRSASRSPSTRPSERAGAAAASP